MLAFKIHTFKNLNEFGGLDASYPWNVATIGTLFANKALGTQAIQNMLQGRKENPNHGSSRPLIDPDGNRVIDQQSATARTFIARAPNFMMELTENKCMFPPHCLSYQTNNISLQLCPPLPSSPREEIMDGWVSNPLLVIDCDH